jgi:hypothetical protein
MRSRNKTIYVILGLIAIGIMSQITANPSAYIIPIAVISMVFILYKFPPKRGRTGSGNTKRNAKKAKFRVIQGNKPDDDNDEKPKYH